MSKMVLGTPFDETERTAATVAGTAYLLFQAPAIFAEFYVPARLFNRADMAQTARNIIANQSLYRLAIGSDLVVCVLNIMLIAGLYVALRRVNRNLAVFAAFIGLIETTILVAVTLNDTALVRALGDAEYVRTLGIDRAADLTRQAIAGHRDINTIGFFFLGVRSATFCLLWYRSRYVPAALAACGVAASALVAGRQLGTVVWPVVGTVITVGYYSGPMFFFEVTMGCWLLFKGLRRAVTIDRAADIRGRVASS
jgi:hypothetical protein